ncbi:MAG: hypothetical protein ACK4M3_01110 [Pyrobaculum sp.]
MLSAKALLTITAALVFTVVIAASMSITFQKDHWTFRHVAESIKAEKWVKTNVPVGVRNYLAYYDTRSWTLVLAPTNYTTPPLSVLALGRCPPPHMLMGAVYTLENNTIHLTDCSYILPAVDRNKVVHYYATCDIATDFVPEVVEVEYQYAIRLVLVKC